MVLNQPFTGDVDNWDPAVLDGLGEEREIILFNNTGIVSPTGDDPNTFAGMAKNAEAFGALGLNEVDMFGFSIRGMVSQQIRSTVPIWSGVSFWWEPRLAIRMRGMG